MSRKFVFLAATFCVCLVASNLFETKVLSAGPLTLTGGFLIFPVTYIINDCLTEVYGFRNARFVIVSAFILNALFVVLSQLVRIIPSPDYWDGGVHFDYIFSMNLRVTVASMTAFIGGSLVNAVVMDRMKSSGGRFSVRAIVSSIVGETADSVIFFPIAFWGMEAANMLTIMLTQILLKVAYEIIVLPVTSFAVRRLKLNP